MEKQEGITLIVLVITIIVILILAGVTVATLTGDNGLLTKAGEVKNTNIEAEGLEIIQLAVMASRDENGIDTTSLAKNLSQINGLTDTSKQAISESTEIVLPKLVKLNNIQYIIYQEGNVEKIIEGELPSIYKQVVYIESSGTHLIDTEYKPKINTELQLDLSFNETFNTTGNNTVIFSTLNTDNIYTFQLNFGGSSNQSNELYVWINKAYGQGGGLSAFKINDDIKTNRNLIKMKSGHITYGTKEINIDEKTQDNDMNLILFGSSQRIPFGAYNMKVYGLKFYEGDKLKRDYIPCQNIKTKEIGLYEVVEGKFYTNQSTGTFGYETEDGTYVAPTNN